MVKKEFFGCIGMLFLVLVIYVSTVFVRELTSGTVKTFTEEYRTMNEYKIVAMKPSAQIEGWGLIFIAYVSTENSYSVLRQRDDGGYEKVFIPADEAIIYEIEEDNYRVEEKELFYITYYDRSKAWLFKESSITETRGYTRSYAIYVPKGTVIAEFKIQ